MSDVIYGCSCKSNHFQDNSYFSKDLIKMYKVWLNFLDQFSSEIPLEMTQAGQFLVQRTKLHKYIPMSKTQFQFLKKTICFYTFCV